MALDEQQLIKGFLGLVVISLLSGGMIYTFTLYQSSQQKVSELTRQFEKGTPITGVDRNVVEKVRKHYLLPDEEPKIVTVQNASDLKKEQQFFVNAKDGDVLLVYSTKVILYDPNEDIILEVAQIRPDQGLPGTLPPSTSSPTVTPR